MTNEGIEDAHDRTHRLAKLLGVGPGVAQELVRRRVALELGVDAAATEEGKLAFLTVCNLATRLGPYAPCLEIFVPSGTPVLDSPVYRSRGACLEDQALWILQAAIPTDGSVRRVGQPGDKYDVVVSVGCGSLLAGERILVGWDGWLALVASEGRSLPTTATHPFGALLASAMAVARLHALQLVAVGARLPKPAGEWRLNAATLSTQADGPPLPRSVALPRTLLVGAGALGSAFCYAMSHLRGLAGEIDAVDPDVLKPANANRQITAPFERARNGTMPKVDDLAASWDVVTPLPLTYAGFKAKVERSASDYELAITAVDNAEARRNVANDLPKTLVDGATGGLMVALMRGAVPTESCVACAYAEIILDEDGIWARRLGVPREWVLRLQDGSLPFDDALLQRIREDGTLTLDDETEDGLKRLGWAFLVGGRCGNAKPDRDLPSASVSYVSAICGFLMAAQTLAEVLGAPALVDPSRWFWGDVLREPPQAAERNYGDVSPSCAAGHDRRTRIYRRKWS